MSGQIVAVYVRESKADSGTRDREEGVQNQIALAKGWIEGGHSLREKEVGLYIDNGYSGTSMERPAVKKLLADIYLKRIEAVVVKDFSRWSRNHLHLAEFLEYIFPEQGVRFIAVSEGYDSRNGAGDVISQALKGIFYEYYCQDISQKAQRALEARKQSGIYAVARAPFGYRREDGGAFSVVPEEAGEVRRIFAQAAEGSNSAQIGRMLGRDAAWVWRVLNNPFYMGRQVWQKSRNRYRNGFYTEYIPRQDWMEQRGTHPAIVSEEEYERAQAAQKHHAGAPCRRRRRHLFHGLTKCGICGRALCRKRREDGVICCKNRHGRQCEIPVEVLWRICFRSLSEICGELPEAEKAGDEVRELCLHYFFSRIVVGEQEGGGTGTARQSIFLDIRCRENRVGK